MTLHSQRKANSTHWKKIRAKVLAAGGYECVYCGANEKLSVDHVIPISKGGTDEMENLVVACIKCNSKKNSKMPHLFLTPHSTVPSSRGLISPQNESKSHDQVRISHDQR
jgi:5-methylcytosine-specific restriction endonuclease McrA